MFCPKCGGSNPDNGKFCRSCGQDLSPVSLALKAKNLQNNVSCASGKEITLESAMAKLFLGVAFLVVSVILGATGAGRSWWFWMLIPAFIMIGSGVAKYMQLRRNERLQMGGTSAVNGSIGVSSVNELPGRSTEFVGSSAGYRTGDLVPPSVTDSTTRHLEVDKEGQTMSLPRK